MDNNQTFCFPKSFVDPTKQTVFSVYSLGFPFFKVRIVSIQSSDFSGKKNNAKSEFSFNGKINSINKKLKFSKWTTGNGILYYYQQWKPFVKKILLIDTKLTLK